MEKEFFASVTINDLPPIQKGDFPSYNMALVWVVDMVEQNPDATMVECRIWSE